MPNVVYIFLWQSTKDAGEDEGAEDDPLRYGPRPEDLVPRVGAAGVAAGDGVYRPPKLNPAAMQVAHHPFVLTLVESACTQWSIQAAFVMGMKI